MPFVLERVNELPVAARNVKKGGHFSVITIGSPCYRNPIENRPSDLCPFGEDIQVIAVHVKLVTLPSRGFPEDLDFFQPPIRSIFFIGSCFHEGIEVHRIMEQDVRIYNAPKTVIDCFRWRNTVGIDVALEGARSYLKRRGASPSKLMEYARFCKVEKLVTPYLEAMVP